MFCNLLEKGVWLYCNMLVLKVDSISLCIRRMLHYSALTSIRSDLKGSTQPFSSGNTAFQISSLLKKKSIYG